MIKVIYARGCYGTYIARCLYHYSNLRQGAFEPLSFDQFGSSHVHRKNHHARNVILDQHLESFKIQDYDRLVVLLPSQDNLLDYIDNHLVKQANNDWLAYVCDQFGRSHIQTTLKTQWSVDPPLESVPRWIMREWCSFWLQDLWSQSYDHKAYTSIASVVTKDVEQVIDDYWNHLQMIFAKLDLTLTVDPVIIRATHETFLGLQRFRGMQNQCRLWTRAVIQGIEDRPCPAQTMFDEAYIQVLLRHHGYHLKCDQLDQFPQTSTQMKRFVYPE